MHIHWFPGHMTKALRLMEENTKAVDAVVYLLDARAPFSCVNDSFSGIIGGKPVLYVLNKVDLADKKKTDKWLAYFSKNGGSAVAVNGTAAQSARVVGDAVKKHENKKAAKFDAKGVRIPTRIMVLGVPNSGKSTLINTLCGKKSAVTGNRPGVTRGKQWVRLQNGMELMDTPGTLYPDFSDQEKAAKLAFIGSIRDEVVDSVELAKELAVQMAALYPHEFSAKYSLSDMTDADAMLADICRKRGFLVRGGGIDEERGAKALIDDFRKGKICGVTLEEPDD